jgi:23S rRNA pseudouridine2604 synthase
MAQENHSIRINKYLAEKGVCSRREADSFIKNGKVLINGKKARLGDKVSKDDKVEVIRASKDNVYLAFNKPRGIATHSSSKDEKDIQDIFRYRAKVYPVGRLDKESEGLIILTNDGRITGRLLDPEFFHEKEYVVLVDQEITPSFLHHMGEGVELPDGYITRECQVWKSNPKEFTIVLTEGKNRQIRKMCDKLGKRILRLRRTRIMNIQLGDLKVGTSREISGQEKEEFLKNLGLES